MLIKYEFENFNSFKNRVSFSLLAPNTKVKNRFKDNYVSLSSEYDVQKISVIVGENAGGKSNFVHSLELLKIFFMNNDKVRSSRRFINSNNLNSINGEGDNTVQKYRIVLSDINDNVFDYVLEYDYLGILNEKLSFHKKKGGKEEIILSANRINIESEIYNGEKNKVKKAISIVSRYNIDIGDKYVSFDKDVFSKSISEQSLGLFVTKLSILGCAPAVTFTEMIKNDLFPESNYLNYDLYKYFNREQEDLDILKDPRFFNIFRLVDYSIVKVKIDDEEPFRKSIIFRKGKDGRIFNRELESDSSGVREFFAWSIQLFKVIYENKIIIADEMDRVLNPVLSDRIVSLINGTDHKGQFIFTTHNVLHLELKTYMKEQIYFITKDSETLESEMYSLSEFPDIRYETSKVYEIYLKGVLGGTASE